MSRTLSSLLAVLAFLSPLPALRAQSKAAAKPAGLDERRKQLDALLAEQWEYTLRTNPEFATIIGDKRHNDRLGDRSERAVLADLEQSRAFLARFEAIETTGFPEQEQLNKALMVRDLTQELDNARFQRWLMPVNQFGGIHLDLPQFVSLLPFTNVKDYEDYAARLNQVPRAFDEIVERMRKGMSLKLMPPRVLLEKVSVQVDRITAQKAEQTPFAQPLQKFPEGVPAEEQARLRQAVLADIQDQVLPAYLRFGAFVKDQYAPNGRSEPGVWSLADGEARYAALVRASTTTSMSPEQIHQLGLKEVARIEGEMLAVAKKLGYADLESFNGAIARNPALHPKSREEMLDLYRRYSDQAWRAMPKLFGRLPKAKLEIKPVEEFREKEAAGAQYNQGTPDGSRPGHVRVNTGDYANRTTLSIETTAYHEGIPGHHMQVSIAQELPTLPPFRQQGGHTAYVEGWALYSERLGRELGFFQDPYSFYGHLQDELLRAIRLVADTGLHHKRWTRQQVVDFFHAHSGIDEVEVQSETDRYIAIPGQALGYKIGQLKLLELRAHAETALGPRFDIRAFHDEVLGAGSLPLEVLEERIKSWVGRAGAATAVGTVKSADGVPIRYQSFGKGEPALVFVHCWSCDRHLWDDVVPRFETQRRVVTIDLAGHGESGTGRRHWTIPAFGRDVKAVVDGLRLRRIVLVGHSMGGPVILEAARLMPARVVGLVPVDTLHNVEKASSPGEVAAFLAAFEKDYRSAADGFTRQYLFAPKSDPVLVDRVATKNAAASAGIAIPCLRAAMTYDARAALRAMRRPAHAVNADGFPTDVAANRRRFASYEVTLMSGVGHYLMLEDPQRFSDLLAVAVADLLRAKPAQH